MAKGISTAYTATYAITNVTVAVVEDGDNVQEEADGHNVGGWPNVHLPFFDIRAKEAKQHSKAQMIVYAPIVYAHQRDSWESFVKSHNDYNMNMNHPGGNDHDDNAAAAAWIPQRIHGLDGSLSIIDEIENDHNSINNNDEDHQFHVPLYQMSPLPPIQDGSASRMVNLDLMSNDPMKILLQEVLTTKQPTLSEILDLKFLYNFDGGDGDEEDKEEEEEEVHEHDGFGDETTIVKEEEEEESDDDPHALLIYPVFDNFVEMEETEEEDHDRSETIRGFVFAVFPWDMIFKNDELIRSMYAVLSDTCSTTSTSSESRNVRQFTYFIDDKKVTLLGNGDHHEPKFDYLGTSKKFELEYGEEEDEDADRRRRFLHSDHGEGCEVSFVRGWI